MKNLPEKTTKEITVSHSSLLRLPEPRNVEEAVRYCKSLLEHFPGCDASKCKHMGKKGPVWVLRRLGHDLEKSKMPEIRHALTTSTSLFSPR